MTDLLGQRLGEYEIVALLGSGGMGAVYQATQTTPLRRDVAIKVVKPTAIEATDFVTRFEHEAQTIASLSHPHIVKIFDYGRQGETVYLVMELLRGGSLRDRLKAGPLPLLEAARFLDEIASALEYAHQKGIIHRDLKPQNVLLDESGNLFLTDFGIAKVLNETTGLTQSGKVMGTPSYMAPEQWQGKSIDARADVYALGVMLFEILGGEVPFKGDTPFTLMYMHLNDAPPSLRSLRTDIPPEVEQVVNGALAKSPSDRFRSASAVAKAFRRALEGQRLSWTEDFPTTLVSNRGTKGRPGKLVLAGIIFTLILLGSLLSLALKGRDGGPTSTFTPAATQLPKATSITSVAYMPVAPAVSPTAPISVETIVAMTLTQHAFAATSTSVPSQTPLVPILDGTVLEVTQTGKRVLAHTTPALTAPLSRQLLWGDRVLWKGVTTNGFLEIYLGDGQKAYIPDSRDSVAQIEPTLTTPGLRVGSTVTIKAAGDGSHLRTSTSTQAKEVQMLHKGDVLSVIGGPRFSEYYVWWQLQLANGKTGWHVDVPDWWQLNPG